MYEFMNLLQQINKQILFVFTLRFNLLCALSFIINQAGSFKIHSYK